MSNIDETIAELSSTMVHLAQTNNWFKSNNQKTISNEVYETKVSKNGRVVEVEVQTIDEDTGAKTLTVKTRTFLDNREPSRTYVTYVDMQEINCSNEKQFTGRINRCITVAYENLLEFATAVQ